jgi:hypothetical protein
MPVLSSLLPPPSYFYNLQPRICVVNQTNFSKAKVEAFLKECLSKPAKRGDFELSLKDGHTAFSFRIYRNITVDQVTTAFFPPGTPVNPVEEKKNGKFQTRKITLAEFETFLQQLLKEKFWDLETCKQSGLPDEGDLAFTLLQKGTPIFQKTVWESCKYKDARTAALLNLITSITPEPNS